MQTTQNVHSELRPQIQAASYTICGSSGQNAACVCVRIVCAELVPSPDDTCIEEGPDVTSTLNAQPCCGPIESRNAIERRAAVDALEVIVFCKPRERTRSDTAEFNTWGNACRRRQV